MIVVGVRASNVEFAMTLSTISVGAQASRARPMEVAYAGTLVPTLTLMLMIRRTGTRAA